MTVAEFEKRADITEIGIEIGALYFKAVGIGADGSAICHFKEAHKGNPPEILNLFLNIATERKIKLGISSKGTLDQQMDKLDPVSCLYTATRFLSPTARNILEVGASHLTLISLDSKGQILSINTNSLCASGTGSFLDTQAQRMGIDYNTMNNLTPSHKPPSIASRCAVFAKSDLVYRQQEGFDKTDMWSGLCRGLVDGLLHSLMNGKPLSGMTILCGGVALNKTFFWWLNERLNGNKKQFELSILPQPEYAVAHGAALLASKNDRGNISRDRLTASPEGRKSRPPLKLIRSRYPSSKALHRSKDGEGNEITVHRLPEDTKNPRDVYLGVDIGSTSTKLVLMDPAKHIWLDVYRRTDADPVLATKKLFQAVLDTQKKHGFNFRIRGAATTGGGRKIIGKVIGADVVINEISAHVKGAIQTDPSVETIFEIGGQDAKFMSVKDGHIVDANMNYVCAAGTGSFVEELTAHLGYELEDIGTKVIGVEPPYTSSRCTVFMEQDIVSLLHRGITPLEAAGAVMYSVIENYLEGVVGWRSISDKRVFFQGATARNLGLVAAIENILGLEVVVSPYCHVMGAFGAAIAAMEQATGQSSQFRGLDLALRKINITKEGCSLCSNRCQISRALIEGEQTRPCWGMKCGRENSSKKKRSPEEYYAFQKANAMIAGTASPTETRNTESTICIPKLLTAYSLIPFWNAFFNALGIQTVLSSPPDRKSIEAGNEYTSSEFCLPIKAAVGQAYTLLSKNNSEAVFIPHMIADYKWPELSHTRFCPYVETLPSLITSALKDRIPANDRIISPVVDFQLSDKTIAKRLVKALSPYFAVDEKTVEKALIQAHNARKNAEKQLAALGRDALENIRKSKKPAVVVIGRPYNTMEGAINHDIPHYIAECGTDVIPMDCLPWKPELLEGEFKNLFWGYGQRILSALIQVAQTEGLYAVYLSNFACGPDSFLLTYAETIMGEKPFLIIELDEHGSSGAYQTRVEAFLDILESDWKIKKNSVHECRIPRQAPSNGDIKDRMVWIPPMHPVGCRLFAASFRSEGFNAAVLPLEDEATFSLGKRWTRGTECLPAPLTLGTFLAQMDKERRCGVQPEKECSIFLPTSDGPCRFGQYRTLDRIVLDRLGLNDLPILSPGAHNAYHGIETRLRKKLYESVLAGDILYKMRCRVLPYEKTRGATEETLERLTDRGARLIENGEIEWDSFLREAMQDFQKIPVRNDILPLVGVTGEIYVRCNAYANSHVVETIESLGGEAWLSPIAEWILYTSWMERYMARREKVGIWTLLKLTAKWEYFHKKERSMYKKVRAMLADREEPEIREIIHAARHIIPPEFEGESILTLGRSILFKQDGADLVVNCAPFGCMHGNITNAVFEHMREDIGIPVVTVFYDGTEDNNILASYLHEARERKKRK
ncbi:MAG: acyl-CoA dehydratase activase [Candidatus Aminicenantes bacterium]|jgi:predicted CoA-substrate-specific enzyme activase